MPPLKYPTRIVAPVTPGTGTPRVRFFPTPPLLYPTRIVSPFAFRSVSSGLRFACGLTTDDRVQCWGLDSLALQQPRLLRSRFGAGDIYLSDATLGEGMRFRTIDAGHGSACGIGQSGTVYCWGAIDIRDTGRDPHDYRRGSVPFAQPRRVRMPNVFAGEPALDDQRNDNGFDQRTPRKR